MQRLPNLPVFLRIEGAKVVLAGEGDAAAWKAELLVAAGAELWVIGAEFSEKLAAIVDRLRLQAVRRAWTAADLSDARVAILEARDDEDARDFREAAHAAGAIVNVIDRPGFCDFSFGAIVERSPLVIAISTDGAAPVFAQAIRARIEAMFPDALRGWAEAARRWRDRLSGFDLVRRRAIWTEFAARALGSVDRPPTEEDFAALSIEARPGRMIVAGVGSGAPDLVTLRTLRALQAADLVIEEGRIDPAVRDLGRREARVETCPDGAGEELVARALDRVADGGVVVVLRLGDGRGGSWAQAAAERGLVAEWAPGASA